jgi:hypothetical protein
MASLFRRENTLNNLNMKLTSAKAKLSNAQRKVKNAQATLNAGGQPENKTRRAALSAAVKNLATAESALLNVQSKRNAKLARNVLNKRRANALKIRNNIYEKTKLVKKAKRNLNSLNYNFNLTEGKTYSAKIKGIANNTAELYNRTFILAQNISRKKNITVNNLRNLTNTHMSLLASKNVLNKYLANATSMSKKYKNTRLNSAKVSAEERLGVTAGGIGGVVISGPALANSLINGSMYVLQKSAELIGYPDPSDMSPDAETRRTYYRTASACLALGIGAKYLLPALNKKSPANAASNAARKSYMKLLERQTNLKSEAFNFNLNSNTRAEKVSQLNEITKALLKEKDILDAAVRAVEESPGKLGTLCTSMTKSFDTLFDFTMKITEIPSKYKEKMLNRASKSELKKIERESEIYKARLTQTLDKIEGKADEIRAEMAKTQAERAKTVNYYGGYKNIAIGAMQGAGQLVQVGTNTAAQLATATGRRVAEGTIGIVTQVATGVRVAPPPTGPPPRAAPPNPSPFRMPAHPPAPASQYRATAPPPTGPPPQRFAAPPSQIPGLQGGSGWASGSLSQPSLSVRQSNNPSGSRRRNNSNNNNNNNRYYDMPPNYPYRSR